MVDIQVRDGQLIVEPLGWSRVWTLRRRLSVPATAVRSVRRAQPAAYRDGPKGWRMPGTHVPGLITAGSYVRDGEWEFWDVRGKGTHAIEVHLSGTRFTRLVVEVADPDATVRQLQSRTAKSS
jgi:hypothetical protein